MQIINATSMLKRRTMVRIPSPIEPGATVQLEARITRIGDRQLARDGKYWAMVYAIIDDAHTTEGTEVSFACVHDGAPVWYRAPEPPNPTERKRHARHDAAGWVPK